MTCSAEFEVMYTVFGVHVVAGENGFCMIFDQTLIDIGIKEGDTYSYIIDSNPAIDVRKIIFNALASKSWPMMGMESLEAELEDVFVKLV